MVCTNADVYISGQDAERCSCRTSGAGKMACRVAPHAGCSETLYSSALSHNAMSLIPSERWPVPRSIDTGALLWCTRCTAAAATQIRPSLALPHSAACVADVGLFQRRGPRVVPPVLAVVLSGEACEYCGYDAAARECTRHLGATVQGMFHLTWIETCGGTCSDSPVDVKLPTVKLACGWCGTSILAYGALGRSCFVRQSLYL
jgi:hypothetical protein